jgi:hypothetical protein
MDQPVRIQADAQRRRGPIPRPGGRLTDSVAALHRTVGNHQVARWIVGTSNAQGLFVQRLLTLGRAQQLAGTPTQVWFVPRGAAQATAPIAVRIARVDSTSQIAELEPSTPDQPPRASLTDLFESHAEALGQLPAAQGPAISGQAASGPGIQALPSTQPVTNLPPKVTDARTIFSILSKTAAELGFDLYQLEMRVSQPETWIKAFNDQSQEAGLTFPQLVDYLAKQKALTNLCGATSGWLQQMTAENPVTLQSASASPDAFVSFLESRISSNWVCRAASGGHSFMLECYDSRIMLYQSWIGRQALATVLDDPAFNAWQPDKLFPILRVALTPYASNAEFSAQMKASRDAFYKQPLKPSVEVTYTLNEHPLAPDRVGTRIKEAVAKHSGGWHAYMSDKRTVRELLAQPNFGDATAEEKAAARLADLQASTTAVKRSSKDKVEHAAKLLADFCSQFAQQGDPSIPVEDRLPNWAQLKQLVDSQNQQKIYTELAPDELVALKENLESWFVMKPG